MKYVNSLKYVNGFECAKDSSEISPKRAKELCELLGRVHIGTNPIFIPRGGAGYATAKMLEAVIKSAGYKVGNLSSEFGADSRAAISIDGEVVSIEDYNRAVAELKSAIIRTPEVKFSKEEIVFALSLLLCKMQGCEYVILQGVGSELCSLCAPYELVVVPSVQNAEGYAEKISGAIKQGVREVVSGNQKRAVYDIISKACVTSGVRLNFTSKTSFKTESLSSIKSEFSYSERAGYSLKSPSVLLRDCAMLVIESALAIRRDGVKMPWTSIVSGLATAVGTGLFETLSAHPALVLDSAGNDDEVGLLISTLDDVFGVDSPCELTLCVPADMAETVALFDTREIKTVIIVGGESDELDSRIYCGSIKEAAKTVFKLTRAGESVVAYGSVAFEAEMRAELSRLMMG